MDSLSFGHFDGEIGVASLESTQGVECENLESQADRGVFPEGHAIIDHGGHGISEEVVSSSSNTVQHLYLPHPRLDSPVVCLLIVHSGD